MIVQNYLLFLETGSRHKPSEDLMTRNDVQRKGITERKNVYIHIQIWMETICRGMFILLCLSLCSVWFSCATVGNPCTLIKGHLEGSHARVLYMLVTKKNHVNFDPSSVIQTCSEYVSSIIIAVSRALFRNKHFFVYFVSMLYIHVNFFLIPLSFSLFYLLWLTSASFLMVWYRVF